MPDLDAMADSLLRTFKAALQERQAVTDTQLSVALERIARLEVELVAVRERAAALEARAPLPGPRGPAGKDGRDGRDGRDGAATAASRLSAPEDDPATEAMH